MSEIFQSEQSNFKIEISEDKFSAYLTVFANEGFVNENELLDLIKITKINYGFEEANEFVIEKEISKDYDQPFPIAIGVKPKETEVEFSPLFDLKNCYHQNIGNQFDALKSITRIKKGDPLAHLFVTKQSQTGINVFGDIVEPHTMEKQIINNYLGDNVSYSEERGQIIADKTGYPYMDDLSRINVKSEFVIDKNIDLTMGDLDFFGSITVNGDIIDKVKIKLDGDLIVNGNINDAELDVQGNITINGDIIDCKSPGLLASGNILFNSAENSRIISGKKINFNKNVQFCKIVAENGIYGKEEGSAIVGGLSNSGEHIETSIIGNTGGIATEIEISISPYTKELMLIVSKQMIKLKELKLDNSVEYQNLHDELSTLEIKLENEVNSMLKNIDNLPKHIMAFKKIFPGTYIRILKKSLHLLEEHNRVSFSIVNGELTNEAY